MLIFIETNVYCQYFLTPQNGQQHYQGIFLAPGIHTVDKISEFAWGWDTDILSFFLLAT